MDPNETLANIRTLADRAAHEGLTHDEAREMADGIAALDEWLSRGGFLPTRWAMPDSQGRPQR